MHEMGMLEFVDRRWSFAEQNTANARRQIFLLTGVLVAGAIGICGVAIAAAAFVAVIMSIEKVTGITSPPAVAALLTTTGAGCLGMAARRRMAGRRRAVRQVRTRR
jgi:hypothetical protein